MAVLSYALTTLAGLKAQLGITSSDEDSLLEDLIDAATERIEREAGRRFAATDYVYWHSGDGEDRILLPQYPVIRVNAAGIRAKQALTVSYSGSAIYAQVIVNDGNLRLLSMSTSGTQTSNDITLDSSTSISEIKTAVDAVSGWSATTLSDGPSLHLRQTVEGALNNTVTLYKPDDYTYATTINADAGLIALVSNGSFWPTGYARDYFGGGAVYRTGQVPYGNQNIMIDYRAGYETIPQDIDQIARELAAQMYYGIGQDQSIQSESLGSYSRTLADRATLTESMRAVLGKYTRELMA